MKIDMSSYTDIGTRRENEDSLSSRKLTDSRGFAVVADGLGSHGGGADASKIAVEALSRFRIEDKLPTKEQIMAWMEDANSEILRKRDGPWHMKTTAVALYFDGNRAIWAHTGDSRLYHFYNGEVADLTLDQSVCQLHVLQGEITRQQIPMHPDRSKVLYVLGEENIKPKIHESVKLQRGRHAFLLCTDGLWERLCEEEIMMDLHWADSAAQWLSSLRTRANLRKYDDVDNNTAVAVIIEV